MVVLRGVGSWWSSISVRESVSRFPDLTDGSTLLYLEGTVGTFRLPRTLVGKYLFLPIQLSRPTELFLYVFILREDEDEDDEEEESALISSNE